jgi:predicted RNA binding protein YcfA (HicA-like mRNA interferase family)
MPKKIRELIKELEQAGFVNRGGKDSHRNFVHPVWQNWLLFQDKLAMMHNVIKKMQLKQR